MAFDFSSLPPGTNGYLALLDAVADQAYTFPASPSFRFRLIVLFSLTCFGLLGALSHLALLLVDGRRRRQRALWLFRITPGYSGRFVVTNVRMVTTLLAIAILTCELGAIDNMWSAALLHHSQRSTSAWRTLLVLPVVAQVWFASWGLLQGYLVRSDLFSRGTGDVTPSRRGLSARTANLLFFSGIIFAVALLSTSIIVIVCGTRLWSFFLNIRSELLALADTWTGVPDYSALAPVFDLFPEMSNLGTIYNTAYLIMYSACAIAMACMAMLNAASFLVARRAGQDARARLEALSTESKPAFLDASASDQIFPISLDSQSLSITETKEAGLGANRQVSRLSRRSLQLIAGKASAGTEGHQATQLLSLLSAERELRVTASWLGGFATIGTAILLFYAIYVCGDQMWQHGTWPIQEAAITCLPWFYIFTVSIIVYPRLVITTWRSTAPCPSSEGGRHSWCLCGLTSFVDSCFSARRRTPSASTSGRVRVRIEEKVSEDYRTDLTMEGREVKIEGGVRVDAAEADECDAEKGALGGGIRRIEWKRPPWARNDSDGDMEAHSRASGEVEEGGGAALRRAPTVSWAGNGIPLAWSMVPPPPRAATRR